MLKPIQSPRVCVGGRGGGQSESARGWGRCVISQPYLHLLFISLDILKRKVRGDIDVNIGLCFWGQQPHCRDYGHE